METKLFPCSGNHAPKQSLSHASVLVFSCDGTLLDTMSIYYESWKRTCDEVSLLDRFPNERFYSLAGVPVKNIVQLLSDE